MQSTFLKDTHRFQFAVLKDNKIISLSIRKRDVTFDPVLEYSIPNQNYTTMPELVQCGFPRVKIRSVILLLHIERFSLTTQLFYTEISYSTSQHSRESSKK